MGDLNRLCSEKEDQNWPFDGSQWGRCLGQVRSDEGGDLGDFRGFAGM